MSQLVVQYSFDEDGLLSRVTAANGGGENWEEKIVRDSEGLKIEKIFAGGIRMTRTYDAYGNVISQKSRSFRQDGYDRRYAWNASGRLQSVIDGITGGRTSYAYDAVGSLMSARYEDGTDDYRMPDATGNVFRSRDRRDREYGKGGRILRDRHYDFLYDVEGNLILKTPRRGLTQHPNHEVSEESGTHIVWQTGDYAYEWYGNGMLKEVRLPYGKTVRFEYDALGRRTAKLFNGHVFRYLWDGNVMVQEWQYEEKDRPQHSIDEFGRIRMQGEEPVENLVTWVYEEGSYVPVAKIQNGERYTIISDYMGRPVEAYNSYGNVVWQADYDIYGDLRNIKGIRDFIPFRQLGQYEDDETHLYYNRFRYYDPRIGNYISQDPIRLAGNNPTLYGYVGDGNSNVDIWGLSIDYYSLDHLGRPTGGLAEISLDSTGSLPKGTDAGIDPPGWKGGQHPYHQQRGHLIAKNHGGSGVDPRNIVTITDGTNHPGMTKYENIITRRVKNGDTILLEVKAVYDGDNLTPSKITMYAIDQKGNVVVDAEIKNGLRQKTSCCHG